MSNEIRQQEQSKFAHWVRATTYGWLLGFVSVLILALIWGLLGGTAQFMVGIGMGSGVGYMQFRKMGFWIEPTRRWLWTSIIGMGIPFVLWDLGALAGFKSFFSLPLCALIGSLLVSVLQLRLLRPNFEHAILWIPACVLGWGLPVSVIALGDSGLLPGPLKMLSIIVMFFGGLILGGVTGKALLWLSQNSTV
jgi:hypothetical protein